MPLVFFALFVLAVVLVAVWRALVRAQRAEFIRTEPLPKGLYDKLRQCRPHLSQKDCQLVGQALRQFFLAWLAGGRRPISMPSQVADELWHEFILHTRAYEAWCQRAFGRFLHHTPAVALSSERRSNEGLRRCWWHTCKAENIDPRRPTRLPLLFAIDTKLAIEGGFRYAPDCGPLKARAAAGGGGEGNVTVVIHCAGDFGSSSIDGSTDGFGGDGGSGGDGGGDGGGCGGGCGD